MPPRNKAPPHLKKEYLQGKLSTDVLIERLTTVNAHLATLDQDAPTNPLDGVAEALIGPSIIRHRDKEVRLLVATSLCDILRLYAPDPPYDNETTREVFSLMIVQMQGLANTESQSYASCFYLLERLAMVRAPGSAGSAPPAFCHRLPIARPAVPHAPHCLAQVRAVIALLEPEMQAGELMVQLFEGFFSVVSADHSTKVRQHMVDIMATVIEEIDTIPQEILDVVRGRATLPGRTPTA